MRLVDFLKDHGVDHELPIVLGDINSLSEEEWLHWREHGPKWRDPSDPEYIPYTLGGSDSATVLCASPWRTRLQLYNDKAGIGKKIDKMNASALEAGHIYEPFVAEVCRRQLVDLPFVESCEFYDDTTMYRSGQRKPDGTLKYPWALADFDRVAIINGEPYIIELKTTSYRNVDTIKKWTDGIVPYYYETQVRHYMAVANIDHAAICCAWGFKKEETALIFLERDMDLEKEIMDAESRFIDCVMCGIEPDVSDENQDLLAKYYARLYGPATDKLPCVTLSDAYDDDIEQIVNLQHQIELSEKKTESLRQNLNEVCNRLLPAFVSPDGTQLASYASYDTAEGKHVGITLKSSKKRDTFDEDRFKAEHPAEYSQCLLEPKLSSTKLRTLDKKLKTSFYIEYKMPPAVSDKPENTFNVKISDSIDLSKKEK